MRIETASASSTCSAGRAASVDREAVGAAVKAVEAAEGQVVTAAMLGHKGDVAVMALHRDWSVLRALQTALQPPGSTSSTATSASPRSASTPRACPSTCCSERLYPQLPPEGKPVFCFYPMSKRREAHANWYATPYDERDQMMREHGTSGRTFAGKVVQLITGSTGLDDFEWGVTLFAATPEVVKDVVYTMRFDKGSALYGEFGRFYVGYVAPLDDRARRRRRLSVTADVTDAAGARSTPSSSNPNTSKRARCGSPSVSTARRRRGRRSRCCGPPPSSAAQSANVRAGDAAVADLRHLRRRSPPGRRASAWTAARAIRLTQSSALSAKDPRAARSGLRGRPSGATPLIRSRTSAGRLCDHLGRRRPAHGVVDDDVGRPRRRARPATSPIADEQRDAVVGVAEHDDHAGLAVATSSVADVDEDLLSVVERRLGRHGRARVASSAVDGRLGQRPPVQVVEVGDRGRPGAGAARPAARSPPPAASRWAPCGRRGCCPGSRRAPGPTPSASRSARRRPSGRAASPRATVDDAGPTMASTPRSTSPAMASRAVVASARPRPLRRPRRLVPPHAAGGVDRARRPG